MKLYYFVVRRHMTEHFGEPLLDDSCYTMWRPSKQDKNIEFLLHKTGELTVRVNGNLSNRFKPDLEKIVPENCASMIWASGFSWRKAEELERQFSIGQDKEYESSQLGN